MPLMNCCSCVSAAPETTVRAGRRFRSSQSFTTGTSGTSTTSACVTRKSVFTRNNQTQQRLFQGRDPLRDRGRFFTRDVQLPTRTLIGLALFFCAALSSPLAAADPPRAVLSDTTFRFERVLVGAVVEHDFALTNAGTAPLRIIGVQMTSPLIVTSMPAVVAPGSEAKIRIKLDTSGLRGHFPGEIQVTLDDPHSPEASLEFEGD